MKKLCSCALLLCLAAVFSDCAAAQDKPNNMSAPPKVLTVTREFVKPGKSGPTHDKSESAFVEAMRKAKWPTYYFGLDSLSGKTRSLFLTGYDSFDAWEKDNRAQEKNAVLSGELQRAFTADGALLDSMDQSVWRFREDMSMHPTTDIGSARMMEFEVFHLKPGHEADWDTAVKMVKDAYAKGVPDAHWDMFEMVYGGGSTFVVITPLKGGAEIDKNFASGKQFMEAMGQEGMKKLSELSAAAIDSIENNLFAINPHMSYVPDEIANSDPDFWRPKGAASAGHKAKEEKEEKAAPAKP
jgi:hypothetical protein